MPDIIKNLGYICKLDYYSAAVKVYYYSRNSNATLTQLSRNPHAIIQARTNNDWRKFELHVVVTNFLIIYDCCYNSNLFFISLNQSEVIIMNDKEWRIKK